MEMYGGGLWHTWFDRELTLSGLAIIKTPSGTMEKKLVTLDRPVGSIPNLCVHLGVEELQDGFKPRKEDHMNMILGKSKSSGPKKEHSTSLIGKHPQELLLLIGRKYNKKTTENTNEF
jgi:aspartyl aminopeptidase